MTDWTKLIWATRARLSGAARTRIRRVVDPLSGPIGSIKGVYTADRVVALTFDDGPDPDSTPGVLDALARHGARATFFVLVDRAEACPRLVRRMIEEGHDVGLHGLDHTRLTRLDPRTVGAHIAEGRDRLAALSGRTPRWFRPPYGSQNLRSYVSARRSGMKIVVWSADCADWVQRPEEAIAETADAATAPGAVILLHDSLAADSTLPPPRVSLDRARMTHLILTGLKARGYHALSLTALLEGRRPRLTAWLRP